jgi:hypothetical protein
MSKIHTCINTAMTIDGSGPPPCVACAEMPRCSHGMLASLGHCDVCTERGRVVAWLREEARRVWDSYASSGGTSQGNAVEACAVAIENGEHLTPNRQEENEP